MGNILTACSSKKHFDKVDDFINVSVHGNVKVVVKAEENTIEKNVEENTDGKEVDTTTTATTTTTTTTTTSTTPQPIQLILL